ncbi:MAG: hypothetical protein NC177_16790 [Ruminococcus flavefaciens]|nr:hypothetical protein [Ruminococcus flavefaciens]
MNPEKYQNVMKYKIMISILKSCVRDCIISMEEYRRMNTIIAEKYGLNSCSIFVDYLPDSI